MKKNPDSVVNETSTPPPSNPCSWTAEEQHRVAAFFKLLHKWDCEQKGKAENDNPDKD